MEELAEKAPDMDTDIRWEGGLCLVLLLRHWGPQGSLKAWREHARIQRAIPDPCPRLLEKQGEPLSTALGLVLLPALENLSPSLLSPSCWLQVNNLVRSCHQKTRHTGLLCSLKTLMYLLLRTLGFLPWCRWWWDSLGEELNCLLQEQFPFGTVRHTASIRNAGSRVHHVLFASAWEGHYRIWTRH